MVENLNATYKYFTKSGFGIYKKANIEPFSKRKLNDSVLGLGPLAKISVGIDSYRTEAERILARILSYPGHKGHWRLVGSQPRAVFAFRKFFKKHIRLNRERVILIDYIACVLYQILSVGVGYTKSLFAVYLTKYNVVSVNGVLRISHIVVNT